MLLGAGNDPRDGSVYYPMPSYETRDHIPFGDRHKVANEIKFEDMTILLTKDFQEQVDGGVICFIDDLIRILPVSEFDDRFILEGIFI